MTAISDRIADAIAAHRQPVTRIYLGIEEDVELSATPQVAMGFVRRKFHGAEIYRVDAATHLAVA